MTDAAEKISPPPPAPIRKGRRAAAWKILIYGHPGVGKSSLAAQAPKPFFLDLENGLERIDCEATPTKLATYEEVAEWLRWVYRSDYETVVIDTIDEIEKMLAVNATAAFNAGNVDKKTVATIADAPWGKGDDWLLREWRKFLEMLDMLQARGKNVIVTGHEKVAKMRNPVGDDYEYFAMNINKTALPVVTAKFDAVLFARSEMIVKDVDPKKPNSRGKAVSTGKRILHTMNNASFIAKNRFDLPETVPMTPDIFNHFN